MAKRFTDTQIWLKRWFRKLSPAMKCFWFYLKDNCDSAGIWDVDLELAETFIGASLDHEEVLRVFSSQIEVIKGGDQWFIVDFITFQQGVLRNNVKPHQPIIQRLKVKGLWEGYLRGINTPEYSIVYNNKEEGGMGGDEKTSNITAKQFEKLWIIYPGKSQQKGSKAQAKTKICRKGYKYSFDETKQAFTLYAQSDKVKNGYIKHMTTFLNGDFVGQFLEEIAEEEEGEKKFRYLCPNECEGDEQNIVLSHEGYTLFCDVCGEIRKVVDG